MNLNNELNKRNINKKLLLVIGIALILICILFVYLNNNNKAMEEPDIVESTTPINDDIEESIEETPIEVDQSDVLNIFKASVLKVRDLAVRLEYDIVVGIGENNIETVVTANTNTSFIDLTTKKLVVPSSIMEGSNIIVYATGKYTIGNLNAMMLCLGSDTSYRYGVIEELSGNFEKGYLCKLNNTEDKLKIDSDCIIYDALNGNEITNLGHVTSNYKVLYKYDSDFEITENGNLYNCKELIIVPTNE